MAAAGHNCRHAEARDRDNRQPSRANVAVAVVDAVPAYSLGLLSMLREAGYAASLPERPDVWAQQAGRCALLYTLEVEADWERMSALKLRAPQAVVVALRPVMDVACCAAALAGGATAVAEWKAPLDLVLRALELALRGQVVLPLPLARELLARPVGRLGSEAQLNAQEAEWLENLAHGVSIAQIASDAGHSTRTMYRAVTRLYRRIGVDGRSEAIAYAGRAGLLLTRKP